jgi:pyruvate formate lyase activating enzyme
LGVCGVRKNEGGELKTLVYGMVASGHIDPIEKKPLSHFYPGSMTLSVGTAGCNFRCKFCQNWTLSQTSNGSGGRIDGRYVAPEALAAQAVENRCKTIAYTYSEPTIFFEYALDAAIAAHEVGVENLFVSNGYMTKEPLRTIAPYLGAANIDIKGFNESVYRTVMGAPGYTPMLDSVRLIKELGIWLEITTLVIPTMNDSDDELTQIARFIKSDLGAETPWHVSGFHPDYKMIDTPPTPAQTLQRACDIGRAEGLYYVYAGNQPGPGWQNTRCPGCDAVVIERQGYRLTGTNLDGNSCRQCGREIAGVGLEEIGAGDGHRDTVAFR